MNKTSTRRRAFAFLSTFGDNIKAKFSNICGKTGAYDIPGELFLKRTARSDRILMPWKDVYANKLTMQQLESFKEGGVVVEFANDDYFNSEYQGNPVFEELKRRLGGNGTVASVITIRGASGTSSSAFQRQCFDKLTAGNVYVEYKGSRFPLTKSNYKDYVIRRFGSTGTSTGIVAVLVHWYHCHSYFGGGTSTTICCCIAVSPFSEGRAYYSASACYAES